MTAPRKLTAIAGGLGRDDLPDAPDFDWGEMVPEKEVPARHPGFFTVDELPELRRTKKIACFKLSAQRIFYRDSDLKAYIKAFYQPAEQPTENGEAPCRNEDNHSSNTETSGSAPNPTDPASTDTGAKAAESDAASLLLQASTPPKLKSSPSPSVAPSSRGHRRQ